jgi:hypothetical protein
VPAEAALTPSPAALGAVANRRVLRLALGTAACLWLSQALNWPLSYISPVITLFLLGMPVPRPQPRFFVVVVVAMTGSIYASFLLLPFLLHQRIVGIGLLGLALFHSFYFTARGGAAAVGTLITMGLAVTVAIGSVSVDALLAVAGALTLHAIIGAVIALLAHLLLPDPASLRALVQAAKPPPPQPPALPLATRHALRSLAMVLPIAVWFLLSSASASNMAVMIKVAAMGQEASFQGTRAAARSLIGSTFIGGIGAVIAWEVLRMWPSLTLYALLIGLAALLFGRQMFQGAGLKPNAGTWSYGLLTLIIILAPAVLDSDFGSAAGARFYDRLFMFLGATLYAVAALRAFEALWPQRPDAAGPLSAQAVDTSAT